MKIESFVIDNFHSDYTKDDFFKMGQKDVDKIFAGSDWLPLPVASVGAENKISYSDFNWRQVDFYIINDFNTKKTYFNDVVKGKLFDGNKIKGQWIRENISNLSADVFLSPVGKDKKGNDNISKIEPGGKIYFIKFNNGKDMFVINKQAKGDNKFEADFTNLIQTLKIAR